MHNGETVKCPTTIDSFRCLGHLQVLGSITEADKDFVFLLFKLAAVANLINITTDSFLFAYAVARKISQERR